MVGKDEQQDYLQKYRKHQQQQLPSSSSSMMMKYKRTVGGTKVKKKKTTHHHHHSSSFMIVDETEDIPNNKKNKDAATFYDNDPYYNGQSGLSDDNEEEEEEGAPIVVDQWGNSLRPLRADDLKHIEEKPQEASAAVVLDEAVEIPVPRDVVGVEGRRPRRGHDKKKKEQHVKLEHTKTTAHDNVPRIKEECNINDDDDKEEEEEERYDSDEDSDQSVVRGDEKVDEPRIKKEVDNNEDGDQSPIRKGVVRMSSGFTAGLVTGEDISKQMEEASERRKSKLQQLPDEISGKGAQTVFRIGGRVVTEEEAAAHAKNAEKSRKKRRARIEASKPEWAGGITQDEILDEKAEHMARVMKQNITREGMDDVVDEELRQKQRMDDPLHMFAHKLDHYTFEDGDDAQQQQKKTKTKRSSSLCKFPMPPNRFNIKPGYRWDGLVRGTNYERRWFEEKNTAEFNEREAFRWIGIDDDGN